MITNDTIKKEIRNTIKMVNQWHEFGSVRYYADYVFKLEILVELLEVDNCGSIGGFDRDQKYPSNNINGLYSRAKWVLSK